MANKIIKIAQTWGIELIDLKGDKIPVNLAANEEYKISLSDGSVRYATINSLVYNESQDEVTGIRLNLVINPGYMDCIQKTDEVIKLENIDDIERIHTAYVVADGADEPNHAPKRTAQDIAYEDDELFTFVLPNKNGSEYRVTIVEGEFIVLVINTETGTRTFYGQINDVDNDNIIHMTRFVSNSGIRDIYADYKVNANLLKGIFRYELQINDFIEKTPEESESSDQ